ncbi:hypothetical protein AAFF_G00341030 [Aldrovandia affinis]|uniref:Uncharacterized protein n=1 Tax=Aldrovandia affinis TaxID=143900 RepID=A0AAD7SKJ5_9TELE|nr:hypothetical protein AAFF_G00341030 [Aldrovandia affinis]
MSSHHMYNHILTSHGHQETRGIFAFRFFCYRAIKALSPSVLCAVYSRGCVATLEIFVPEATCHSYISSVDGKKAPDKALQVTSWPARLVFRRPGDDQGRGGRAGVRAVACFTLIGQSADRLTEEAMPVVRSSYVRDESLLRQRRDILPLTT